MPGPNWDGCEQADYPTQTVDVTCSKQEDRFYSNCVGCRSRKDWLKNGTVKPDWSWGCTDGEIFRTGGSEPRIVVWATNVV